MNKLVVLSGVPGSGKSYFSTTLKKVMGSHVYCVSSDNLRREITGSQKNLSGDSFMWDMFYGLAEVYSKDKNGVVVLDATNYCVEIRVEKIRHLRPLFDEVDLVLWNIDKSVVSAQNLQREFPIPPNILEEYFEKFEMPTDVDRAFFDKIVIVEDRDINAAIEAIHLSEEHVRLV